MDIGTSRYFPKMWDLLGFAQAVEVAIGPAMSECPRCCGRIRMVDKATTYITGEPHPVAHMKTNG